MMTPRLMMPATRPVGTRVGPMPRGALAILRLDDDNEARDYFAAAAAAGEPNELASRGDGTLRSPACAATPR